MTELGDAGLTEAQVMALSAHETPDAARLYVKRTEVQLRRPHGRAAFGSTHRLSTNKSWPRVGMM